MKKTANWVYKNSWFVVHRVDSISERRKNLTQFSSWRTQRTAMLHIVNTKIECYRNIKHHKMAQVLRCDEPLYLFLSAGYFISLLLFFAFYLFLFSSSLNFSFPVSQLLFPCITISLSLYLNLSFFPFSLSLSLSQ